jgi:hypothetical protein
MHEFSVSKDMNFIGNDKRWKDCVVGKLSEPLCLTLIITQMSAHYVLVGFFYGWNQCLGRYLILVIPNL